MAKEQFKVGAVISALLQNPLLLPLRRIFHRGGQLYLSSLMDVKLPPKRRPVVATMTMNLAQHGNYFTASISLVQCGAHCTREILAVAFLQYLTQLTLQIIHWYKANAIGPAQSQSRKLSICFSC